ncbi:MAG: hypothetical protein II011_11310, partial [Prevotella sp.]|nr:hypothetical protein [Prevotella sp.]
MPAGSDATATVQGMTLVLGIPKGADGRDGIDGQNAVNPFKGWFTTDNIPTTGQEGDYCNVSNTSVTPHTVTIYRWDATQNAFVDTGEVPDTATGETFASSETLQQVAIDDSHLVNPVNTVDSTKPVLARAEDAQLLMKKIFQANEVDLNSIQSAPNMIGVTTKKWIAGSNGGSHKFVQVEEGQIITIYANSDYNTHFAFTSTTDSEVGTSPSYVTEDQLQYVTKGTVKNVIVPPLAKYMYLKDKEGTNLTDYLPSSVIIRSSQDLLFSNEVVDGLDSVETKKPLSANQGRELDNKITDLPYTLSNVEPLNVDFSQLTENIIPFVIGVSTKTWFAPAEPDTIYRSSYVIKISEGSKIEVTANSEHNANIAFLNGYPNPVEGEPANLVSPAIYSIQAGTSRTLVTPAGTKYLYVKKGDGKINPDYNKPASLTITPIELATKEEIESFEKVVQPPVDPTLYNAIVVNAFIGASSLNWVVGDTYRSAFIPVNVGDKVHIVAPLGNSVNCSFISEYPQPQAGVAAPLVGQFHILGTENYPVREGNYIAPEAAKFFYVKLREGSAVFTPSTLEIMPNSSSIIKSYYSEDYEDTYIEEDIFSKTPEKFDANYTCVKWYKIDHTIKDKYKLIIKTTSTDSYLRFADANKEIMTDYNVASTQTELKVMDNVVIPEGAEYILVQSYLLPSTGSTKVTKGCGALMKPLKYCNSTPKNDYIYCVSRISDVANTPNNYYSDEIYPTISDWSAWMFRLPKNTNSVEGKPNPIASFFHGQSGWVSSEQMGYNKESSNTRMIEDLVDAGFIVFDVNGYGVSWESDEKSMFWGCRMGVDTAKKAYETIVERFNGRRGFFVSGISMGGA